MKLLIVSGRSGSGKTTALQALEDQGYYCVDNLPLGLLPALAEQLLTELPLDSQNVAVGIDARNLRSQLPQFGELLAQVKNPSLQCEVIYLDADADTLLKRFSSTRRRHPLSDHDMSLSEAIAHEKELLSSIQEVADLLIDTRQLTPHELRNLVRERVAQREDELSLLIQSFGFKHGAPTDADLVFDVRMLPNPYWDTELRPYNGKQQPVIDFLDSQPQSADILQDIEQLLLSWLPRYQHSDRSYITVAIGCTGGQHRSVYTAEAIAKRLSEHHWPAKVRHLHMR